VYAKIQRLTCIFSILQKLTVVVYDLKINDYNVEGIREIQDIWGSHTIPGSLSDTGKLRY
jgi:hypothetical protein